VATDTSVHRLEDTALSGGGGPVALQKEYSGVAQGCCLGQGSGVTRLAQQSGDPMARPRDLPFAWWKKALVTLFMEHIVGLPPCPLLYSRSVIAQRSRAEGLRSLESSVYSAAPMVWRAIHQSGGGGPTKVAYGQPWDGGEEPG